MKRITFNFAPRFSFPYLILSLLLTVSFSLSAQVYSGNIYLNSQADVDAFSYTEVTGFLAIIGTDINHLDGLSSLTSIGGDLIIYENPSLTNINGLSALTSVGKTLEIVGNASLLNIDGLSSLVSVGAELPAIYGANFALLIISNPLLTDLDGLSSLSALNEISRMWV
ncbi:MAG: hypothetical protein KDD99_33180, partial [Bacteroidetes bacterium]|nr:hypothetical protein [Bacteroidota bacterium]